MSNGPLEYTNVLACGQKSQIHSMSQELNIISIPGCCWGSLKMMELVHSYVFNAINRVGTQVWLSLDNIMSIF